MNVERTLQLLRQSDPTDDFNPADFDDDPDQEDPADDPDADDPDDDGRAGCPDCELCLCPYADASEYQR
jgi:hypothetical protein